MSERELFNEWIKHYEKHDVKIDQLQRAFMWQAWQASANRQGYKLVPVDTLEECLNWASIAEWDSPDEETDAEINHHRWIIESMLGVVE